MSDDSPFASFIENYKVDGEFTYYKQVSKLASMNRAWFQVDFQELYRFNPEYGILVVNNHEKELKIASDYILEKLRICDTEYAESLKTVDIRIVNLPDTTFIRELNANLMNRLLQIEGTVVQRSKPILRAEKIMFKCKGCGAPNLINQNGQYLSLIHI